MAEFVRDWRRSDGAGTIYYSADAQVVARFVRRLDRDAPSARVDLSSLPVGLFLLAAHGCIDKQTGQRTRVRLTTDALQDMAGSGFLEVGEVDPVVALGVLRRAAPFFAGCYQGHDWVERARALNRLVRDEVAALGARTEG